MIKEKKKKAICGICPAGCWVEVSYDNEGKLKKVEEDKDSPLGAVCKLAENAAEIVYSEHRLKYPLKRTGKKGTQEFERISWDEAYDIIVNKLQKTKKEYGPEATAIYTGRGNFETSLCDVFHPKDTPVSSASSILFPFGSPNTFGVGALCYVAFAMIAPHVTMGGMYHYMYSDIENAETVVIWGANPATDTPPTGFKRVLEARKRGSKIVVIDPRRTSIARLKDVDWVAIRPGTDGALALGLCNIIIREELYDTDFVKNWTVGFEDFSKYAQQFRPEIVEQITGIDANKVIELAKLIADSNGAAPLMYTGLEYTNSGVQNIRALFTFWALAGQLDVPGGYCFSNKKELFNVNKENSLRNPDLNNAVGLDRFPLYSYYRGESHGISIPESVLEEKPYRIRDLIIHGGSLITAWPEPEIWRKTLEKLDFLVVIDRQLTADSAYADIVLPATTMFEIRSYKKYGSTFRIREKVIEPVAEARNDYRIVTELAERLGYGDIFPKTEDEMLNYVLKDTGFTLEEVEKNGGIAHKKQSQTQYKKWNKGLLRDDGKPGFDTPTGKFEIASSMLKEFGYDALPIYEEPTESPISQPELYKKFPLIFNSGARVTTDFRSQHHGIKGLLKERPEPTVTINIEDANDRNIKNGDSVYIITKRGKVKLRAFVTPNIMKGAIDANMGGGGPVGPKEWQDCNINDLTDLQNYDPISGFPVYKALLCDVIKAEQTGKVLISNSGELNINKYDTSEATEIKRIYLDHNATSPIHEDVKAVMIDMITKFGNPSSIYKEGKETRKIINISRKNVARLLNTTAGRITFTGGGSESNNYAIKGVAYNNKEHKNHIVTTEIEHPSIINTCKQLESHGFKVTYLKIDKNGLISNKSLENAITDKTCLVSIMTANNETGVIQPIKQLCDTAHRKGALFHTDAVQAVGKIVIDVKDLNIDILSLSGHKLNASKGIGVIYIKEGLILDTLISGGSQEENKRAGTENTIGIAAMSKASELAFKNIRKGEQVSKLRDYMEKEIVSLIPGSFINSKNEARLPNTSSITFPDLRGESLVLEMDKKGVSISSGSACRSGSSKPSYVLKAYGLSDNQSHCSIRISLGFDTTEQEIKEFLERFKQLINKSKLNVRFIACK